MPKAATYTLAWSAERQAYTLYNHHTELDLVLGLDTPTWREWLEQVASFAFRGQKGTYTARKGRQKSEEVRQRMEAEQQAASIQNVSQFIGRVGRWCNITIVATHT